MRRRTLICCCFLLIAGTCGPGNTLAQAPEAVRRTQRRTPIVEVFESCRDAVVNISTTRVVRMRPTFMDAFRFSPFQRHQEVHSIGSGVVVHDSGFIITNAHVVGQVTDVRVTFANEQTLPADVVAVDQENDLAVLKVDSPRPLESIQLGHSDDLMIGETVVAIGNPHGLRHTVTAGIISALDRELTFSPDVVYRGLIQTDAPINPGNSGGPLLNIHGELIGINTAIRGDAQSIGFAIPVDKLWELVPAMLDIERRARVRFGLEVRGPRALVQSVRPNSPAAQAGLRPRDRVLAFNGDPLRDAIDFQVHMLAQKPDSTVQLRVARGDDELDVKVPLELIPPPDGNALARALFGMELREIPVDIRRRYDLPRYIGVIVDTVQPGSAAEYAGVEPGDVILRLHRGSVATLDDVGLALEQTRPGQRVLVEGLRLFESPPFLWTATLRAQARRPG